MFQNTSNVSFINDFNNNNSLFFQSSGLSFSMPGNILMLYSLKWAQVLPTALFGIPQKNLDVWLIPI